MRVLLVSGAGALADTWSQQLRRAACAVRLAETLPDARASLASWRCDIVVLDFDRPDGALASLARELAHEASRVSVVALYGERDTSHVEDLAALGVVVLAKPIGQLDLLAGIARALEADFGVRWSEGARDLPAPTAGSAPAGDTGPAGKS